MKCITLILLLIVSGCATMPKINPASTVVYTSSQIEQMILDEFERYDVPPPRIGDFKDRFYTLPEHDDMVKALNFIAKHYTPKLGYEKEVSDCDNFAGLIGNILPFAANKEKYRGKAIPLSRTDLYWNTPHEVLAWIDNKGFWIAEPQAKGKAKIYNIKALPQFKTIYALEPI